MLCEGLSALVNSDPRLQVIGFANSSHEAIRFCQKETIDCALIDFSLPDQPGTELISFLSQNHPDCVSILLTMHKELAIHQQALELGAAAVILKESASEKLICEIVRQLKLPGPVIERPTLSAREQQVLQATKDGLTAKEIGSLLGISHKTVETYRERLFLKFGVRNTNQLIYSSIRYSVQNPPA